MIGFDAMRDALGSADAALDWLAASAVDPATFLATIAGQANGVAERPLASQLGVHYDFFHDLCARFCAAPKPLCAVSEPRRDAWLTLSYPELAVHATRLHAWWLQRGLAPGQCLCLVAEPGLELAVTVLAALRMGLVFACLPPRAPSFVRARVRALGPDALILEDRFHGWVESVDLACRLPPVHASFRGSSVPPDSYVYDAKEPALRCFGPYGPDPLEPLVLHADALYAGLMTDATLVWPVLRGDRVAAPGSDALAVQPTSMLTCWFGGGEYCVIESESARRLRDRPPTVLFVDAATRDQLLETALVHSLPIERWFRDPSRPSDDDAWRRFARPLAERGARGASLLQASCWGGSLLCSRRLGVPGSLDVLPTPGRRWMLADLSGSGEPALGDAGVYASLESAADGREGRFVISRWGSGYRLVGTLDTWRAGWIYPLGEVRDLLVNAGLAEAVAVVSIPSLGRVHEQETVLAVFVDPRWSEELAAQRGALIAAIRLLIEEQLGAWAAPERVEVFPLLPVLTDDGQVDASWARRQLLGNVLAHKARRPVFTALASLMRTLDLLGQAMTGSEEAR